MHLPVPVSLVLPGGSDQTTRNMFGHEQGGIVHLVSFCHSPLGTAAQATRSPLHLFPPAWPNPCGDIIAYSPYSSWLSSKGHVLHSLL